MYGPRQDGTAIALLTPACAGIAKNVAKDLGSEGSWWACTRNTAAWVQPAIPRRERPASRAA